MQSWVSFGIVCCVVTQIIYLAGSVLCINIRCCLAGFWNGVYTLAQIMFSVGNILSDILCKLAVYFTAPPPPTPPLKSVLIVMLIVDLFAQPAQ